jgi:hypothetical protein
MKWISYFSDIMDKYIIHIINVISLLFIFRGSLPAFKYPFIILYVFTVVYLVLSGKIKGYDIKRFLKSYLVIILLVIYLCVSLFSTYKLYLDVVKDLINTLVLLSVAFFYTVIIKYETELKIALNNLVSWVIVLSTLIAVVWIFDFIIIYLPDYVGIRPLNHEIIDYNFAIIPALFGIVSVLLILPGIISKSKLCYLTFLLLLLYLQLFLSTSRRGFIIAITILCVIFILYAVSFFVRKDRISNFAKNIRPFLLLFVVIFFSGYLFVKKTSFEYKTALFKKIGIENSVGLTNDITEKYLRILNIFYPDMTINELYEEVWSANLDPKDPDSGWGRRIHKTIFPLSGKNASMIPAGVKGYLMDKTCNAYVLGGNSYSYTKVDMKTNYVLDNDTIKSSVFCFVSDDYDGNYVYMVLSVNDGASIGYAHYNLDKKGVWQELTILMPVSSGLVTTYIYFTKTGASSFSNLKGHVIFAFPQFTNMSHEKRASVSGTGNTPTPEESSLINYSRKSVLGYDHHTISLTTNPILSLSMISSFSGGDPIRNLAIRLFPKDTTYLSYKSNLKVDPLSNEFGEERLLRWQFAWQIFQIEYNWKQRIFGGGFSFLNWYGYYFMKDKTAVDYPHNPFLSILLYSGVVGLLLYCFFMYKVFYYYIKYRKKYPVLFIFFLITFFFSIFSGGSPFDPPVFGFFVILPFFIHSVYKAKKLELENGKSTLEE